MGWWSNEGEPDVAVSDETLDLTHSFLLRLVEIYEDAAHRKPTPRELAKTLEMTLAGDSDLVFEGGETLAIKAVVIRTTLKPRKQKFCAGDVFAVDLSDGTYGFGRIMNYSKRAAAVEFFSYTSKARVWSPDIKGSGRSFGPIFQGVYVFEKWEWIIVASDPAYVPSEGDMQLEFALGGAPLFWTVNIADETLRKGLSKEDVAGIPTGGTRGPEWAAEELRKALKA